ncbi:hypothetical protein EMIT0196MI5_40304 [Pseudomonas sp. IT-196MI5]
MPSAPNARQLCGNKREVIVHTDTWPHKFDDEMSQIYVAFVKGLKRSAVLVKTFFNFDRYDSKATMTQTPQGTQPGRRRALVEILRCLERRPG